MKIKIKEKELTPNLVINYILSSVIEDIDNNFDDYASIALKEYNTFDEETKNKLRQWKEKNIKKVNMFLHKDQFI
jgi:hypothetical protein